MIASNQQSNQPTTYLSPIRLSPAPVVDNNFFKVLPKISVFRHLIEPKIIDLMPNKPMTERFEVTPELKQSLDTNRMSLQMKVSGSAALMAKYPVHRYLCIYVNNICISDTQQKYTNAIPFDFSPFCRQGVNWITLMLLPPEYPNKCVLEVSVNKYTTNEKILLKLLSKRLSEKFTKELIDKRMNGYSTEDIVSTNTSIKLSLICPISLMRMKTPCRSMHCRHIECFDAQVFVALNEEKIDWFCPICHSSANLNALRVDSYFINLLISTSRNVKEVIINSDHTFIAIESIREEEEESD